MGARAQWWRVVGLTRSACVGGVFASTERGAKILAGKRGLAHRWDFYGVSPTNPEPPHVTRIPVPVGYAECGDCGRWPEYCRC